MYNPVTLPTSFDLAGRTVPINVYPDATPSEKEARTNNPVENAGLVVMGAYSPVRDEVELLDTGNDIRMSNTLVHEMIEAIVLNYELDIKHRDLNTLGMALHQAFCSNGGFVFNPDGTITTKNTQQTSIGVVQ